MASARRHAKLIRRELAVAIRVERLERLRGVLHFLGSDHAVVIGIDRANDRRGRGRAMTAARRPLLLAALLVLRTIPALRRHRLRGESREARGKEKCGEFHGSVCCSPEIDHARVKPACGGGGNFVKLV